MNTLVHQICAVALRCIFLVFFVSLAAAHLHAAPVDSEIQVLSDSLSNKPAKHTIPELQAALARLRNIQVPDEKRRQLADLCCDIIEKGVAYKVHSDCAYGIDPTYRITQDILSVISDQNLTDTLPRLITYFVDQRLLHRQMRQDILECIDALGAKQDAIRAVQLRWIEMTLTQLPGGRNLNDIERKNFEKLTKEALQKKVDNAEESHEAQTLLFKALQFEDPSLARIIITIIQKPGCHWILKENGARMLGDLQSEESLPFLIEILKQPVPDSADIEDYGDVNAILRSQATMAIGKIGSPETSKLLEKISEDEKEFARVRESAGRALSDIKAKVEMSKILNYWISVIEEQPKKLDDYWIQARSDRYYELSMRDAEAIRKRLIRLNQQLGCSAISK